MNFSDIDKYDWGNKYTISGMVLSDADGNSITLSLPQDELSKDKNTIINLSKEEWDVLLYQLDRKEVEGIRKDQKVVLRKSQRNIDVKVMWKVFRRDKFQCRYCGINNIPLTVDHIITWESGGATHEDNLLSCCKQCNKKRGNTPYDKWIGSNHYANKADKFLSRTRS